MKKHFIPVFLITLLLSGCNQKENANEPSTSLNQSVQSTEKTSVDIKFTEEKWKLAFSSLESTNFKVKSRIVSNSGDDDINFISETIIYDDIIKTSSTNTESILTSVFYFQKDNDKYYKYTSDGSQSSKFKREESDKMEYDSIRNSFSYFTDKYSSFTYSEKDNSYKCDSLDVTGGEEKTKVTYEDIIFTFDKENKKVLTCKYKQTISTQGTIDQTSIVDSTFSYDVEAITLPEFEN